MNSRTEQLAELTRQVGKVHTAYRQYIQNGLRERNIDLTFEMLQVMACLWSKDGINQQEIANITFKDKASMTYLIDNLTKRGMVYRQEDSSDRRNKLIVLTTQGRELRELIQPLVAEMHRTAGGNMDSNAIGAAMAVLEQVERNLKGE